MLSCIKSINGLYVKKQEALQKRLDNVQRWADAARKRMHNASTLYRKRCQLTKERATELYRVLNNHHMELERQGVGHWQVRQTIKEKKATADTEIEEYRAAASGKPTTRAIASVPSVSATAANSANCCGPWKTWHTRNVRCTNWTRRLDQIMTVCKLALANVGMWVRDRYFPVEFAQASWHRLQPFFQLPGWIDWVRDRVEVELKPFNDCTRPRIAQRVY
jgi:hypothetical protein